MRHHHAIDLDPAAARIDGYVCDGRHARIVSVDPGNAAATGRLAAGFRLCTSGPAFPAVCLRGRLQHANGATIFQMREAKGERRHRGPRYYARSPKSGPSE